MIKIMISAGEISGDMHGGFLAAELKKINRSAYLFGMGGSKMSAAGVDIKIDISSKGTVGAVEIIKFLPHTVSAFFRMKALLKRERPDVLVLVDYQGFNMLLASYAKKLGIKTIYYICPQEWLWGTPKGVNKVAKTIDRLLCIFEEEARIYREAGGSVVYVGNPNLDTAKPFFDKNLFCRDHGLNPKFPIFGIFPGSRQHEISSLLPVLLDSARIIKNRIPNAQFVLAVSSTHFLPSIKKAVDRSGLGIVLAGEKSHDIFSCANVSMGASGTAILEAAILDAPVIAIYSVSNITYFIAKYILRIKLSYFTMPNLLAGKEVVPELIQSDINAEKIAGLAVRLLTDKAFLDKMKDGYRLVRSKLGAHGAVKRAAEAVFAELKGKI